jgi:hypothetical protein
MAVQQFLKHTMPAETSAPAMNEYRNATALHITLRLLMAEISR